MEYLQSILQETNITPQSIWIRLLLSLIIGAIVGIEREKHKQPAGLRTHILICMGSTLIMLLSIYIPQTYRDFQNGDPGRIAAQVISGIGFLGAGAIMKYGVNVKGLTTAASIWVVAALGLAIGAGMFWAVLVGTLILLFALVVLDALEKKIFAAKYIKRLNVYVQTNNVTTEQLVPIIKSYGISIRTVDLEYFKEQDSMTYYFTIHISEHVNINNLTDELSNIHGVTKIKLQQVQ